METKLNIQETKAAAESFAQFLRVFDRATVFLANLEGVEGYERELQASIAKLKDEDARLIQAQDRAKQLITEYTDRAEGILKKAKDDAKEMRDEAKADREKEVAEKKAEIDVLSSSITDLEKTKADLLKEIDLLSQTKSTIEAEKTSLQEKIATL